MMPPQRLTNKSGSALPPRCRMLLLVTALLSFPTTCCATAAVLVATTAATAATLPSCFHCCDAESRVSWNALSTRNTSIATQRRRRRRKTISPTTEHPNDSPVFSAAFQHDFVPLGKWNIQSYVSSFEMKNVAASSLCLCPPATPQIMPSPPQPSLDYTFPPNNLLSPQPPAQRHLRRKPSLPLLRPRVNAEHLLTKKTLKLLSHAFCGSGFTTSSSSSDKDGDSNNGDDLLVEPRASRSSGTSRSGDWLMPGSTYLSEMRFPIIGKQVFRLLITGSNTAQLDIQGRILRLQDDNVLFTVDDTSGDIHFVLSHATYHILRRFRTRLGRVAYDVLRDEASLEVRPPLPTPIRLRFKRV